MQSLIEANKPRAVLIAAACASRLNAQGVQSAWTGYHASEGLEGELVQDTLLRYARPGTGREGDNFALLFFRNPKLTDVSTVNFGDEIPVEKNIVERFSEPIEKVKGIAYEDTVEHTFTKTTSLQEAFKVGAELAVKAYFKASYSGVEGGAEVSAKLTAEYSRQWGESETTTNRVERHISLPEDYEGKVVYEAIRSIDKVQRKVTATSNLEYEVSFVSGPTTPPENHPLIEANWQSLEEFLSVAIGYAAADKALYHNFINNQISHEEVYAIKEAGKQSIEFLVDYDNVQSQEIRIV